MQTITEGKAIITIPETKEIVSKQLDIFYNPIMKTNRDISIAVINAWEKENMQIADVFAASGVRSIRFLKELDKDKIKAIWINDKSEKAIQNIKNNLKQNNLKTDPKITITKKDADIFLLESKGFDYIDIDPFGTPVPFLDSACKRLSRDSILAVTATDTSALAGTFPKVCKRNYDAAPLHCPQMHEIGIRILIRKCQIVAAQYKKALTPLLSYFKDHYMRVFLSCEKGKKKVDDIMKQHQTIDVGGMTTGPVWVGPLWKKEFIMKMKCDDAESSKFLELIKEEVMCNTILFYDMHALCKQNRLIVPKFDFIIAAIQKKRYIAVRTHFTPTGIRSNIPENELCAIL